MPQPHYIASDSIRVACMRLSKWGDDYPQFANDAQKVAAALLPYLDETPVDDGWIKAVGAEADFDSYLDLLFSFPLDAKKGSPTPRISTRGAVRALCAVLQVPIKDVFNA